MKSTIMLYITTAIIAACGGSVDGRADDEEDAAPAAAPPAVVDAAELADVATAPAPDAGGSYEPPRDAGADVLRCLGPGTCDCGEGLTCDGATYPKCWTDEAGAWVSSCVPR